MIIFANREQTIKQTKNRQTNSSNTEATLIPCGSSEERANSCGDKGLCKEQSRRAGLMYKNPGVQVYIVLLD